MLDTRGQRDGQIGSAQLSSAQSLSPGLPRAGQHGGMVEYEYTQGTAPGGAGQHVVWQAMAGSGNAKDAEWQDERMRSHALEGSIGAAHITYNQVRSAFSARLPCGVAGDSGGQRGTFNLVTLYSTVENSR